MTRHHTRRRPARTPGAARRRRPAARLRRPAVPGHRRPGGGRRHARPADARRDPVVATADGLAALDPLAFEHHDIVAACRRPQSIAEIAARLRLHLNVVRVLAEDLRAAGHLAVHVPDAGDRPGHLRTAKGYRWSPCHPRLTGHTPRHDEPLTHRRQAPYAAAAGQAGHRGRLRRRQDHRRGLDLRDRAADHRGRHHRGRGGRGRPHATLPRKTTTTVAMDFGCITIDPTLKLYLFGTPGPGPVRLHVGRHGRGRARRPGHRGHPPPRRLLRGRRLLRAQGHPLRRRRQRLRRRGRARPGRGALGPGRRPSTSR